MNYLASNIDMNVNFTTNNLPGNPIAFLKIFYSVRTDFSLCRTCYYVSLENFITARQKLTGAALFSILIINLILKKMKYRLVERGNPSDLTAPKKWYANPVNAGKFTIKDFAGEIAGRSSLTRGDIENVLNNFVEELPTFLKIGLSISLGSFGTMRLSISSEGTDTPETFNVSKIRKANVIFTPSAEIKSTLQTMSFEEAK